jgi:hypothetical protein
MTYCPQYATITQKEVNILIEKQAPRSVWAILWTLNGFMASSVSCFPSIKTIRETLNNHLSISTIEKGLKWLVDNLIIQRNNKYSKNRFINLIRILVYGSDEDKRKEPVPDDKQATRKPSTDVIRKRSTVEKKYIKEQNPSLYSPLKGEREKQQNSTIKETNRTKIVNKIKRAEKRIRGLQNLLTNTESPEDNQSLLEKETNSILNYCVAVYQLGQDPKISEDEKRLLIERCKNDSTFCQRVKEHRKIYSRIKSNISV